MVDRPSLSELLTRPVSITDEFEAPSALREFLPAADVYSAANPHFASVQRLTGSFLPLVSLDYCQVSFAGRELVLLDDPNDSHHPECQTHDRHKNGEPHTQDRQGKDDLPVGQHRENDDANTGECRQDVLDELHYTSFIWCIACFSGISSTLCRRSELPS